ncbi:Short chain dehydrogenase [Scedosporium apiospermum]|uniref:Short chain dehydrogenase n=1 Tax=Pseudallescheria apiosperma TaxID=563466 RepID=A0A084FX00_PSEDA|nr:Short chain dehydrogenase [Scedosporium apiospermum]KEZ39612.1 Short chain dehydrogenase [Scedosporium apiospermum]
MSFLLASYRWIQSQRQELPYPTQDLTGKTIIVTGANSGLGREAARHFARLNARVILACRNRSKGEAALADIRGSLTGTGTPLLEVWDLDLESHQSAEEFLARAERELDRVDVLVNNASVAMGKWEVVEGREATVTVNVVSTFLLTVGLLGLLGKTAARFNADTRVVVVSSEGAAAAKFKERNEANIFNALQNEAYFQDRYFTSKLLQLICARKLASTLPPERGIIVTSLSPGLCNTDLFRNAPWFARWILGAMLSLVGRSAEMGSRTLVSGALAGSEMHGEYMRHCGRAEYPGVVEGEEGEALMGRVWGELLGVLEEVRPGVTKGLTG